MRYGVLGPLTVWDLDGRPVKVPEAGVRALLADLLTHEGRTVSADRLVDDLWGDHPPGKPANALQTRISMLRRVLGRDRVVHQAPGYRLVLDRAFTEDADLDAHRFTAVVERAGRGRSPGARRAPRRGARVVAGAGVRRPRGRGVRPPRRPAPGGAAPGRGRGTRGRAAGGG